MHQLLQYFILFPLLAFFISLLIPAKRERILANLAISNIFIQLLGLLAFLIFWIREGFPILDSKHITFFQAKDIEIFVDFYFDKATAVYAFVGTVVALMVAIFSKYYLHRDEGFKRYFVTILIFFCSYNLVIFSGNFETLFMGWEILGICSFLLIAFYRDRYLPVKNSIKVISIYRLGDICLILTMWMSHQLWHENITFFKLNDEVSVQAHLQDYHWYGILLSLMLVVAAATKSAQLPFSSWLPRAMEGPTTSSAIFYGSLSIHLGVFILLRTYPYWESLVFIKVLIIMLGLATSVIASSIARVQSTVKTQIAYSSITQIGLMFIEVAMGWHILALIHFTGNALLRTYQLLVSPSVLSYLIHDMVFSYEKREKRNRGPLMTKLLNTLYILSIKEWNLDTSLQKFLWNPFKWLGGKLLFLSRRTSVALLILVFLAGLFFDLYPSLLPAAIYAELPVVMALIGLLLILVAFTERVSARRAWTLVIAAQLFISLSIALFHEDFGHNYLVIYLSGALASAIGGYLCLQRLSKVEKKVDLNRFYGHSYEHPGLAFLFLICALGLVGFPFTPTFIGIDLLFSHIHREEILIIILISLSFIFMELAVLRIYARLFLGQHVKTYHAIAYRSS